MSKTDLIAVLSAILMSGDAQLEAPAAAGKAIDIYKWASRTVQAEDAKTNRK